jgi:hypothetical protein
MTSARMASTFVVGAFGAAFLLAQSGTGQAQLLPRSELVTAKSQPGDDGARRAPLDSGVSNDLDCANPPAEGSRAKVFVPRERPRSHRRREGKLDRAKESGTALLDDPGEFALPADLHQSRYFELLAERRRHGSLSAGCLRPGRRRGYLDKLKVGTEVIPLHGRA